MNLFEKYNVATPRYTSYPSVPYWSDPPSREQWLSELKKSFAKPALPWALYLHIPFCENLCSFCGCNTSITRNHKVELPYIKHILQELEIYQSHIDLTQHPLKQIHIGGGTPSFLSSENLDFLLDGIFSHLKIKGKILDGSMEIDPRHINEDQLKVLRRYGFHRLSMGVQDFNKEVQVLINRIQPYEVTRDITASARALGFSSINFDLIYGLPKQSQENMQNTLVKTIELLPERIALYSLALVPWIKPAQRLFKTEDLPQGAEKRALYEMARRELLAVGYVDIGMDHFALPHDSLNFAFRNKSLHRNFMGYTDTRTSVLLGLGVSAISEVPSCFHQNQKALPVYERQVSDGQIPTLRGHRLSDSDRFYREQILKFMTSSQVKLKDVEQVKDVEAFLGPLIEDGLVKVEKGYLRLTELGRPFLRNACVAFDHRLRSKRPQTQMFSKSL